MGNVSLCYSTVVPPPSRSSLSLSAKLEREKQASQLSATEFQLQDFTASLARTNRHNRLLESKLLDANEKLSRALAEKQYLLGEKQDLGRDLRFLRQEQRKRDLDDAVKAEVERSRGEQRRQEHLEGVLARQNEGRALEKEWKLAVDTAQAHAVFWKMKADEAEGKTKSLESSKADLEGEVARLKNQVVFLTGKVLYSTN